MTNFTVKVRADESNVGSNRIEVFLDTEPKQEIMILTDRGDDANGWDEEPRAEDTALYYAVERIAQLEAQLVELEKFKADASKTLITYQEVLNDHKSTIARLIKAGDGMYTAFDALMPGLANISLNDYSVINDNPIEWQQAKKAAEEATNG